jgi:hypothetical protein
LKIDDIFVSDKYCLCGVVLITCCAVVGVVLQLLLVVLGAGMVVCLNIIVMFHDDATVDSSCSGYCWCGAVVVYVICVTSFPT